MGSSRARLQGAFFNASTPTAGSSLNDIVAGMRIIRLSNSTVTGYVNASYDNVFVNKSAAP